ncbi:MAG TPA: hypothetical protein VF369_05560 [candidate division Zixibacteria bacterium]
MSEEFKEGPQKGNMEPGEKESREEIERPGRLKHERLKQERIQEAQYKEKQRGFRKTLIQKGKHIFDRMRKSKFLGGTKGRRGA